MFGDADDGDGGGGIVIAGKKNHRGDAIPSLRGNFHDVSLFS